MKISTILNIHNDDQIVFDTLDSILTWMTDRVLVVSDGESWQKLKKVDLPAFKLDGFRHGCSRAPYRNVTLGLMKAYETWPDSDWYCYLEYDCLVGSADFYRDLEIAEKMGIWCLGNDHRIGNKPMNLLEGIFDFDFKESHYLLGCCVFYSNKYLKTLTEMNFFDRFLFFTNPFTEGFFPGYEGHDLAEHMYPSIANFLGGKVMQFAQWSDAKHRWLGNWKRYPLRFRPELENIYHTAAIMHPSKKYDDPLREYHRKKRQNVKSRYV